MTRERPFRASRRPPTSDHQDGSNERGHPEWAWPDPRLYRQELPVAIRSAFEWGEIDENEVWHRLVRLWGHANVQTFLRRRAA